MKILHIFDHSLPLHSGYTFRSMAILRAQQRRGWETVHLTTPRHGRSAAPGGGDFEDVDDLRFWRTAVPKSPLMRTPAWPFLEIGATRRRLHEVAARERPDILHAHSPSLNAHPAIDVGRALGIPVVYEVRSFWEDAAVDHGTATERGMRYRLMRWHETSALRAVDQVTTICEGLRRDIFERRIDADRITVIPNAVDVERFKPVEAPDVALRAHLGLEGCWVLGFCGSFYAYEGLDLAIRALPAILAQQPDVRLLLVGGGPEADDLRRLAVQLGLQSHVVFTGRVPNREIDRYYSLISLLLYPRKRMRLTELVTPLKPLEAMAQGLPVLASDVGGHKELICDRDTGILFSAEDARALAEGVLEVRRNPELVARLKRRGREFVAGERSWTISVGLYESVYAAALARRR